MLVLLRLSHHSNTGKMTYHRDTSYALLLFLTLCVGLVLASVSWTARSSDCGVPDTPQCSGSYTVTAVVPGPRPTKPVVITNISPNQHFPTNPVTVEGTCQAKTLVKIFTNGVLIGSIICGANGRFSIPVNLVIGRNDLTAQSYNVLDQEGPAGGTLTVFLDQPPGGIGFSTELIIQSVNFYRGTQPGEKITWPIELVGGQAPYAVSIDWGDGTSDLITRLAPGPFTVDHVYKKTGGYLGSFPLIIRATDSVGHLGYLQLTTLVNTAGAGGNNGSAKTPAAAQYTLLWPLWVLVLLMILSFWLGERREKKIMERRLAALA